MESAQPVANEEIVAQLVSMGFSQLHCQKAAINTSNAGVEEAMNWLLSHMLHKYLCLSPFSVLTVVFVDAEP